jgi:hypothetical protein
VHTADRAVPPLAKDEDLAGRLDDLEGFHPGLDLIRAGVRLMATERLTREETQTLIAKLGGSSDDSDALGLIGALVRHLADSDFNPCLRDLAPDTQADLRRIGGGYAVDLSTTAPRDLASELSGRIDPYANPGGE